MPRKWKDDQFTVTRGEGVMVITERHRAPLVAHILGEVIDSDAEGAHTVWLDRRVHSIEGECMGGWIASGAISTVLQKPRGSTDEIGT